MRLSRTLSCGLSRALSSAPASKAPESQPGTAIARPWRSLTSIWQVGVVVLDAVECPVELGWGIGRALSRRVRVQMMPTAAVPRDDDGAKRR